MPQVYDNITSNFSNRFSFVIVIDIVFVLKEWQMVDMSEWPERQKHTTTINCVTRTKEGERGDEETYDRQDTIYCITLGNMLLNGVVYELILHF